MNSSELKTVLVVEDNPDLRLMLKDQLSLYYKVIVCECAYDALEQIEKNQNIAALVTDVNLGFGMNGWSLIRKIKQDSSVKIDRIVVVSASIDAVDIGELCSIPVFEKGRFNHEDLVAALS